jgi:hypothetical protein
VASARRIWDSKHGEEMGIENPGAVILKKIRARKDILVNGLEKALKKVLRTMIILNSLEEKLIFIKL